MAKSQSLAVVRSDDWRYVDREFPETARELIARHSFVSDGAKLRRLVASLVSELNALLAAIETPASGSARR